MIEFGAPHLRSIGHDRTPTIAHGVADPEWLKELRQRRSGRRGGGAERAAGLHQLRDRLTPEEAIELGASSRLVRGIYYGDGASPRREGALQANSSTMTMKLLPRRRAEAAVKDVFASSPCDPGRVRRHRPVAGTSEL
jgi:hypothetical protein